MHTRKTEKNIVWCKDETFLLTHMAGPKDEFWEHGVNNRNLNKPRIPISYLQHGSPDITSE